MWVYEEIIEGKKLTDIINETHENVKYLPGHKLPENVVSTYLHSYLILSNKLHQIGFQYGRYHIENQFDVLLKKNRFLTRTTNKTLLIPPSI